MDSVWPRPFRLILYCEVLILLLLFGVKPPGASADVHDFQAFCDFRPWDAVGTDSHPIYDSYMSRFAREGVTALILINKASKPPFLHERRFLADARARGVNVWIRTNRVSPKRGIPGRPNSTLDFVLDPSIQRDSLDYLSALAELSAEYPNLTGLVIGGEELVGAKVDRQALSRYRDISIRQLGFSIAAPLNDARKILYFDWIQDLQNQWYSKIWDTLKTKYPRLQLFIYPSEAAVCGGEYSRFPRPAYWDIHDLIVTRRKSYGVILPSYTINGPFGVDLTVARAKYLQAATEGSVPFFLLLQFHRTGGGRAPTRSEMIEQVTASLANGAAGVGFWPVDMDVRKDIFEVDRQRWQDCFTVISEAFKRPLQKSQPSGLYVLKPRYSQYWEYDDGDTLKTFAMLHRWGFEPDFLLAEQALGEPLPGNARCFYLPETYKYENPEIWNRLQHSQKLVFFGRGASLPFTPSRSPLPPLYGTWGLKERSHANPILAGGQQNLTVSWKGDTYNLSFSSLPPLHWQPHDNAEAAAVKAPDGKGCAGLFLAFSHANLTFLAASDYDLLLRSDASNQNRQFLKALLTH